MHRFRDEWTKAEDEVYAKMDDLTHQMLVGKQVSGKAFAVVGPNNKGSTNHTEIIKAESFSGVVDFASWGADEEGVRELSLQLEDGTQAEDVTELRINT